MFQKFDPLTSITMLFYGLYVLIILVDLLVSVIKYLILKSIYFFPVKTFPAKQFHFYSNFNDKYKLVKTILYRLYSILKLKIVFSFVMTILTFLISIRVIFYMFYYPFSFLLNDKISSYLTLTIILTAVAYSPDKLGFFIYQFLTNNINRLAKKKKVKIEASQIELDRLKGIILFLRPKLWIYLMSIFITLINSMEKISSSRIIINQFWMQIKPIAFESVITMIVIDRFINLFRVEYKKIREQGEAKQLIQIIKNKH